MFIIKPNIKPRPNVIIPIIPPKIFQTNLKAKNIRLETINAFISFKGNIGKTEPKDERIDTQVKLKELRKFKHIIS